MRFLQPIEALQPAPAESSCGLPIASEFHDPEAPNPARDHSIPDEANMTVLSSGGRGKDAAARYGTLTAQPLQEEAPGSSGELRSGNPVPAGGQTGPAGGDRLSGPAGWSPIDIGERRFDSRRERRSVQSGPSGSGQRTPPS